jgi:hypothetical protein
MKKIKFGQIKDAKVLTREQLKTITGGDPYPDCPGTCGGGDMFPWSSTCHVVIVCTCKNSLATWSNC